jgi:hypothetical protein
MQWARANGCPWDEDTCGAAAQGGQLKVLQWACANGCLWDEKTSVAAAHGGHLEVLQLARTNGCPWNDKAISFAAAWRTPKVAAMSTRQGLSGKRGRVRGRGGGWTP